MSHQIHDLNPLYLYVLKITRDFNEHSELETKKNSKVFECVNNFLIFFFNKTCFSEKSNKTRGSAS